MTEQKQELIRRIDVASQHTSRVVAMVTKMLAKFVEGTVEGEERDLLSQAIWRVIPSIENDVRHVVNTAYAANYTESELADMAVFFESSTGKKMVEVAGAMEAQMSPAMESIMSEAVNRAIAEAQKEALRVSNPSDEFNRQLAAFKS